MTKAELIKILENYNDYTEIHLINNCQDIDMGPSCVLNTVVVERSNEQETIYFMSWNGGVYQIISSVTKTFCDKLTFCDSFCDKKSEW